MSEFVWRSGSCGSAVSIHHGSGAVGQFPIFPSLWAPTAPPSSTRSYTAADGVSSSHLFRTHSIYTEVLLHWKGKIFSCYIEQVFKGTSRPMEECRIVIFCLKLGLKRLPQWKLKSSRPASLSLSGWREVDYDVEKFIPHRRYPSAHTTVYSPPSNLAVFNEERGGES